MRARLPLLLLLALSFGCAPGADIYVGDVGTDAGPNSKDASHEDRDASRVMCDVEADCPHNLHCNPRSNLCVECLTMKHCPLERPLCIDGPHVCGQCATESDCPADRPLCTQDTHECVQCESATDCSMERPLCLLELGRCVLCRSDEDCPTGSICELGEYHCEIRGR